MQPLVEHRIEVGGVETRALELEGEGPPVVLLHGFCDSADTWRLTLDALAREDRRAIAVDMPGFGAASGLDVGPVLPQLDGFADALLDWFAPSGAIVAGNSLGGVAALRLAERRGEQLAGIVPVAPAGLDMPPWLTIIESEPLVRALLASPVPVPRTMIHAVVGQAYRNIAFARPRSADVRVVRSFCSHFRDKDTARRFLGIGRRMWPELADPFRLDLVSCPVLVVWGKQDRMVHASGAQRVLDAVPGARAELIDRCGHCPQVEAPERFTELLVEFPQAQARAA